MSRYFKHEVLQSWRTFFYFLIFLSMIQPRHDTLSLTDNTRIDEIEAIVSPIELIDTYPLDSDTAAFIELSRNTISNIINLQDDRLLVITGPCSIHDIWSALEYARRLQEVRNKNPHLFLVMRTYFEKPRTTIWWKWLLNDPHLDDSCDINTWLKKARELLLKINQMWIPTAVEFLDTITPQYIADLVSYGAIGARTTESQEHRKLVSGLSMPVGFKNGTSWDIDVALHAMRSAQNPHTFLSVTKDGGVAKVKTHGNRDTHIILRWWNNGPNYDERHMRSIIDTLDKNDENKGIVIDVSHGNSEKNYLNQPKVARCVSEQIAQGQKRIVWVMIEWHLKAGTQKFTPGKDDPKNLDPNISITDGCVDWETNRKMLRALDSDTGYRNSN